MAKQLIFFFFFSTLLILGGCSNNHDIMIYKRDFYYNVNSIDTNNTITGSQSNLNKCLDNNNIVIDEKTGSPALEINFTFTNVSYFSEVIICQEYTGSHDLHMRIYNYNISQFVNINDIGNTDVINCNYKNIGGSAEDFINNGEVIININHPQNGVNSHDEIIDCMRLKV